MNFTIFLTVIQNYWYTELKQLFNYVFLWILRCHLGKIPENLQDLPAVHSELTGQLEVALAYYDLWTLNSILCIVFLILVETCFYSLPITVFLILYRVLISIFQFLSIKLRENYVRNKYEYKWTTKPILCKQWRTARASWRAIPAQLMVVLYLKRLLITRLNNWKREWNPYSRKTEF